MTKTLVVAGVGPGLGASIVRRFAEEGFHVGMLARSSGATDALSEELGEKAVGIATDLTDAVSVRKAFTEVRERLGPVDVLVKATVKGASPAATSTSNPALGAMQSGAMEMTPVPRLNELYRSEPGLHRRDSDADAFSWIIGDDAGNNVLAFLRTAPDCRPVLVVSNFSPRPRHDYRVGVPIGGTWSELANGDDIAFGGSGAVNGVVNTEQISAHGHSDSLSLTVPPLGTCFFTTDG